MIQALKSLNLESNRLSPDTLAGLFESIANDNNGIVEIHVSNQAQSNMGSDTLELFLFLLGVVVVDVDEFSVVGWLL